MGRSIVCGVDGSGDLASTGTEGAIADEAIMRWENEGGASLSKGSPALERRRSVRAHTTRDALEPRRSEGPRPEVVSDLGREARGPRSAPAA